MTRSAPWAQSSSRSQESRYVKLFRAVSGVDVHGRILGIGRGGTPLSDFIFLCDTGKDNVLRLRSKICGVDCVSSAFCDPDWQFCTRSRNTHTTCFRRNPERAPAATPRRCRTSSRSRRPSCSRNRREMSTSSSRRRSSQGRRRPSSSPR